MKNTIELYNHHHNGDIFYTRVLVNSLLNDYNVIFYHNLNVPLFSDLNEVTEIYGIPNHMSKEKTDINNKIINTWIGQQKLKYLLSPTPGCNFTNYFELVKDILTHLNLPVKEKWDHLPTINFINIPNYEDVLNQILILKKSYKKILLICNGNVHSGQSSNFDMSNSILRLSDDNQDCLFLITHNINHNKPNVIYINNITKILPDLLQIGFISTYCDIIVGRASGPHCFTHIKENLMDKNKTFISFTNNHTEGKWFLESKSKQIWSDVYTDDNIYNLINNQIKLK
jgi:hypothetical protein